ncbi:hypothetical protein VTI74DRAFT_10819 [Chaetomium olivicolor]
MHNGEPADKPQPLAACVDDEVDAASPVAAALTRTSTIGSLWKHYFAGVNALLVFVPLGLVAGLLQWHPAFVSAFNFLGIIPLSAMVSDTSDRLADSQGSLAGALINATFGNAVELIVGILAIRYGQVGLAQSMMIGSILSDILCMLGVCLIVTAGPWTTRNLNSAVVDALSSLMTITAATLVLPTALYSSFRGTADIHDKILVFSRATAVVLLLVYCVFIYFQMWSHQCIFSSPDDHNYHPALETNTTVHKTQAQRVDSGQLQDDEPSLPREQHVQVDTVDGDHQAVDQQPEEAETTSLYALAGILVSAAAVIMWCTHMVIKSLDGTVEVLHISKTFFATMILPMASNAPEFSSVIAASKNRRINFAVGVIAGSILQIALFVTPSLVLFGWFAREEMTLSFEVSQTCIMFLAVLIVNQVLQEGAYTYLHGVMLLVMYATIALAYFVQPDH